MSNYLSKSEIRELETSELLRILIYDTWKDAEQFYNRRLSQKVYKLRIEEQDRIIYEICKRTGQIINSYLVEEIRNAEFKIK